MQLHFKELGQGAPLVLLHGLFGSSDNWLRVAPKFAEEYRVFLLDLRNHGHSPHSSQMNYALMAEDVAEFLKTQALPQADVMGHSMGGKVAMQLALSHPGLVRKLVVADMAPRAYAPAHEKILAALLALDLNAYQTRRQIEDALESAVPSLVVRRFLLKNLARDSAGASYWKINLRGIAENYSSLGEAIAMRAPFNQPALFIRGGKSDFLLPSDEPLIRELFPQSEIQTIADAAHWVHADQPEVFAKCVLDFLR